MTELKVPELDQTLRALTMRDYFAAAAVQGLLSCRFPHSPATYARQAYEVADAMLAERAK